MNPKPIFEAKHDFIESLDQFIREALALRQAVNSALDLDLVKEPAKSRLMTALDGIAKVANID